MIVGVPTETAEGENRVALVPPVAEEIVEDGHDVLVAAGAGDASNWSDRQYEDVGCEVVSDREAVFERADIVFQVRGLGGVETGMDPYRDEQVTVGLFEPYSITDETYEELATRNVSAFALELMPRISRAQSMDALTSQASLGGYRAALLAAEELPKMLSMEMTAAGTVRPAEVFIVGAGVAGLKAIATAKRLGASVLGYDIRLEAKQEVESLGADFLELDLETEGTGDDQGYAQEMDEEFYAEQRRQMERVVPESDIIITTAAIPGRPAPELVTTEMVEQMDSGSVIVDVSAPTGGNCEPTEPGETVHVDGVTVFGPTNLPSRVSNTASQLYANNVQNFFENLLDEEGNLDVDFEDEIIDSTLLVHDGTVRKPHIDEPEDIGSDDTDETATDTEETDAQQEPESGGTTDDD